MTTPTPTPTPTLSPTPPTPSKIETNNRITNRKIGRWYLGETLGKGGYSWVKKGYGQKDGHPVALKFTPKSSDTWDPKEMKRIDTEIEALRQIRHNNVVELLGYNLNAKYPRKNGMVTPCVMLVLEYLPGGELFDILYYSSSVCEEVARTYFHQLLSGLQACHDVNICHRDIKPQNLLLDAKFQLKIADFGLAKVFEDEKEDTMDTYGIGTRGFRSPEIINKKPYTNSCDIFSCGVVLFILLAGYPPFETATPNCKWYAPLAARDAKGFWRQHRGSGVSSLAKDLITRMIWCNGNKRISGKKIKNHDWFNGETLEPDELTYQLQLLQREIEIKRKSESDNSSNSNTNEVRAMIDGKGNQIAQIFESTTPDPEDDNKSTIDATSKLYQVTKQYYQGEVIENVKQIVSAVLKSESLSLEFDCISQLGSNFWDHQRKQLVCDNLVTRLAKSVSDNDSVQSIAQQPDAHIQVLFSSCDPPQFTEYDTVTLKDVFTTCMPPDVLTYAQKVVHKLNGKTELDMDRAELRVCLRTHNITSSVTIQIRIFRHDGYGCYLVKFERVRGDALHFGRVLKNLVKQCGPVLTGLPAKHVGNVTAKETAQVERHFGTVGAVLATNQNQN